MVNRRPRISALLCVLLLCAVLSACDQAQEAALSDDMRYYDAPMDNIIEIPAFVGAETPDLLRIQGELEDLKEELRHYQEDPFADGTYAQVVAFPTTTKRYLNLSIVSNIYLTYGSDGVLYSWVYDKQQERQVTLEDALSLAQVDKAAIQAALEAYYQNEFSPDYPITLGDWSYQGFRIKKDGGVDFYLYASNADDGSIDTWRGIFTWSSDGKLIRLGMDGGYLVPGDEVDSLGAPLWCQWPNGTAPEGLIVEREFPVNPTALDLRNGIYTADWGAGQGHLQNVDLYRDTIYNLMSRAYNCILTSAGFRSVPDNAYTDENGVVWHVIPQYDSLSTLRVDCEWWFTRQAARTYCSWVYEGDFLMEHNGRLYQRADFLIDGLALPDTSYYDMDALVFHGFEDNRLTFTLPNANYNTLDRFILVWNPEHGIWQFEEYSTDVAFLQDTLLGELWSHTRNYVFQEIESDPEYSGIVNGVHVSSLVQYPTQHRSDGVAFQIYRATVDVELSSPEWHGQALEDYIYRDGDPNPWLIFAVQDGTQCYLGALSRSLGQPDSSAFTTAIDELWAARQT